MTKQQIGFVTVVVCAIVIGLAGTIAILAGLTGAGFGKAMLAVMLPLPALVALIDRLNPAVEAIPMAVARPRG